MHIEFMETFCIPIYEVCMMIETTKPDLIEPRIYSVIELLFPTLVSLIRSSELRIKGHA